MKKKAILFGASGFIGSYLLEELLNDSDYEQITIIVRKTPPINHPKLKILIGGYQNLPDLKSHFSVDEIFIALGTTKKNTPNEKEYYQIDHDYPVLASRFAKENGATSVFLVSSVGANSDSSVFYVRMKGETEHDILLLDFKHTHIFRPSMLMGSRKENRPMEKYFISLFSVINPLLLGHKLKQYRGIDGKDVARSMIKSAKKQSDKIRIYHWQEMKKLLLNSK